MNQIYDTLLILSLKLFLIIGFIALIKFWIKKTNNSFPIITYWVFGLFFVLMLSFQVFEWIRISYSYQADSQLSDKNSDSPLSAILGIAFYLYIGLKYLKRGKTL